MGCLKSVIGPAFCLPQLQFVSQPALIPCPNTKKPGVGRLQAEMGWRQYGRGLPSAQRPLAVKTIFEGGHRRYRKHSHVTNQAVSGNGVACIVKEETDRRGANRDDRYQNEFLVHSFWPSISTVLRV